MSSHGGERSSRVTACEGMNLIYDGDWSSDVCSSDLKNKEEEVISGERLEEADGVGQTEA